MKGEEKSPLDASKEVRSLLEFLYLDVKVRSPAEIQDLTDGKLMQERADLVEIPTAELIKDIRGYIEILLSIKNDQTNTNGGHMDTLIMQDDSVADRTSFDEMAFGTSSPRSINPFEKANKTLMTREGPGRDSLLQGMTSIKSQSLFSNTISGKCETFKS